MNSICLNMIVKNEAHIIEDTLSRLVSKVTFSYYVICDTGSTDNTVEIIKNFFENKIPGEIHIHEWKDFGHNRSLALKEAHNKADYILIFDADDYFEGTVNFTHLTHDAYMLKFGNSTSAYERMNLVKGSILWKYVGVLHEYITTFEERGYSKGSIPGEYYIVSGRTSSRNMDPKKYLNDALILEKGFHDSIEKKDSI